VASRTILLFARSPRREAAAKRLAHAAPLFRTLIAAWLRAARAAGAVPLIACAVADRDELASIAPDVAREWLEQRGATFGERAAAATADAFARGYASVVIAAIDAPPPDLELAFAHLERGTPVIAPSRDGGINCLGLTSPATELVACLTPRRRDLVALCRRWFPLLVVLDAVTDLDSPASLEIARGEGAWRGYLQPQTRSAPDVPTLLSHRTTSRSLRAPPVRG
jgi:glycosyltransferase A (GT-A) superfamily protein (DUF2064 family)